ncbi:hypothetical protein [Nonomuraea sp. NPDC049725]|uniref:hypothetical protein n=1 Tax=Nonomuraea sp. NPDC049725 TaxID=3154508 RepID=UPI003412B090
MTAATRAYPNAAPSPRFHGGPVTQTAPATTADVASARRCGRRRARTGQGRTPGGSR